MIYPLVRRPPGVPIEEDDVHEEPGYKPFVGSGNPFRPAPEPAPPPPPPCPWSGDYAAVRDAFARDDLASAFAIAAAARRHDGSDVLALLALARPTKARGDWTSIKPARTPGTVR